MTGTWQRDCDRSGKNENLSPGAALSRPPGTTRDRLACAGRRVATLAALAPMARPAQRPWSAGGGWWGLWWIWIIIGLFLLFFVLFGLTGWSDEDSWRSRRRPPLRAIMFIFGIGLVALWVIGMALGRAHWFSWIDLAGGALGIYGALVLPELNPGVGVASGFVFSLGIIALWIVGLALGVVDWLTWVSFGLAALLLIGSFVPLGGRAEKVLPTTTT
jgi:magnesium-transporting ATPase (P-type)